MSKKLLIPMKHALALLHDKEMHDNLSEPHVDRYHIRFHERDQIAFEIMKLSLSLHSKYKTLVGSRHVPRLTDQEMDYINTTMDAFVVSFKDVGDELQITYTPPMGDLSLAQSIFTKLRYSKAF